VCMSEPPDVDVIHSLKNHICIIVGFCELMLTELPVDDPCRKDLTQIYRAAKEAMAIMPEVARRARTAC
jgi:hypothetical protein